MTFKGLALMIGKEMFHRDKHICYPVIIKDFRFRYGIHDALITPVGGTGEQWVEYASLLGKDQV